VSVVTAPQAAGGMLAAGGICEFASPTEPSGLHGAQISPAAARAPDPPAALEFFQQE